MKNNKSFLMSALVLLTVASLAACSKGGQNQEEETSKWEYDPEAVYAVGDTVKEWKSEEDFKSVPLNVVEEGKGSGEIVKSMGNDDNQSLHFTVRGDGYITSDIEEPFFKDYDAKDGDAISLYAYIPSNSGIKSLALEARGTASQPTQWSSSITYDQIEGTKITAEGHENQWNRMELTFETVYTLGAIVVNYELEDGVSEAEFYVDDINIEYGEETIVNDYVSNNESLYKSASDYLKVGCCMSANQIRNTKARKVVKEQFNSVTAENEGKPQSVIDVSACQQLADKTQVAITFKPFEKIYDWCYLNNIGVRHHTFVWYSQTPNELFTVDYSSNGALASRDTMLKRMDSFMRQTIEGLNERWPGLVYAIDVVNEAVGNGGAGYNSNNKWFDTIGEDFVYQAFRCAYRYKEEGQDLYYNDYDFDYNTNNCTFALEGFLAQAIEEKIIDGVGIQGHIDPDNIRQDIAAAKLIKEKGLKCQITELDITTNNSDDGFNRQKTAYKSLVSQILELNKTGETDVNAIIVWGITDDTSWKSGQVPLLLTNTYKKKPAYYGFLEALNEFEGQNLLKRFSPLKTPIWNWV